MQRLLIGLSAWIIQDGNYPDFEAGKAYDFALEFYPHVPPTCHTDTTAPSLISLGDALYDATGSVIFGSEDAWIVDFGVAAFREEHVPAAATVGTSVKSRIYLGVDPFFYFERLSRIVGMPKITQHWFVHGIQLETTPWVESLDENGRKFRTRDESRKSYHAVNATDAWKHDGGHGHYLLDCEWRGALVA